MKSNFSHEAERYELSEAPPYHFETTRRDLFKALGAGLLVLGLVESVEAQESGRGGGRRDRPEPSPQLGAWLHIGEDGGISAFTGKAEVGQNTRSALIQGIAEELRVPIDQVKLVMADTDLTPFDMGTFGSRSMPDMLPRVRKAAATAREALLQRGAEKFGNDASRLKAEASRVTDTETGKSFSYGELVSGQSLFQTAQVKNVPLAQIADWSVLGKSSPKANGRSFVTGGHQYTSDMNLPGMLHGLVLRPPSMGASLRSVNLEGARSIPGVSVVRDANFVGIAAPGRSKARAAAAALKAEWDLKAGPSDGDLFSSLKKTAQVPSESTKGSLERGLGAADRRLSGTYTVAYIAHAPLEPRAAVAKWDNGKLTVWTGTQRPFGVRQELAEAFSLPESRVRVIVPDTGSGYGGKHTGEAAIEAARLAKEAGKPVKLVWTREDEFARAYFRPAGVIDVQSGVRNDGTLTAWGFHNYNSGGSGLATLYEVPNQSVHFVQSDAPLRQGSYRGLAATANHFAREVHMDELAHAVGKDALQFRLQNLQNPRLRAVFERGAEAFGWTKRSRAAGRGFGMGGGYEKGGYVATFAEVTGDSDLKNVRVERVLTVFECGAIVNPDHLRNQVEGAVVQGLGGALTEAIHFENGKITNGRFSRYKVPRFKDMPVIETVLINRKDLAPAGAGETPIVGVAPAIGNAIFDATSIRLRSLPMLPESKT